MESSQIWIKQIGIFKNISQADLVEIAPMLTVRHAKKNDALYSIDGTPSVRFLINGHVLIQRINAEGDQVFNELVLAGGLFGEYQLMGIHPLKERATVVSAHATYACIAVARLTELMMAKPVIALEYLRQMGERLQSMESRYIKTLTNNAKSRLIDYIKELAAKEGIVVGSKTIIKNNLTHIAIANLISISRQTVTCILNELRASGIINYNRRTIELNNNRFAGGQFKYL
jgi:CRP/FNR family transcriptional regulator, cyclic AMP receptor protein